jgi:hypothetical protein
MKRSTFFDSGLLLNWQFFSLAFTFGGYIKLFEVKIDQKCAEDKKKSKNYLKNY